jgi:cytosine/adenosine deaminase-related metal-dependent hydrolase
MFTRKRGALFELVHNTDPTFTAFAATTPVQYLHKLGALTKHTLGVHLNYLAPTDFEIIARSRMSVVHCPRSHEYFRHQPFAAEKLLKLGVNICLGTDSAATIKAGQASSLSIDGLERDKLEACPTLFLDMFSEMRSFHRHHPKIPPREILKMATLNGARALGQQKNLGSIERGKFADLIAVPAPRHSKLIEETVIAARTPATFSMIGGERLESKLLFETASN